MKNTIQRLAGCDNGAVAPTIALSLVALIVAGGVAFDYARLATMDTELQNAADQAALAAASQLDGETNACSRASSAAVNLVQNRTVMANDINSTTTPLIAITSEPTCDATGNIRFWQNKEKTTAATTDANAKFVEVQTASRRSNYTLTPIVAGLTGTTAYAQAFAGLGNAICKVPPLMMCNPNETASTTDDDFVVADFVGRGIRLVANDGGGGYGPGNFGFLDAGTGNGAAEIRAALGQNVPPGDCLQETGVTTQPGQLASALDAINTRFDIYSGNTNQPCTNAGTGCRPSTNSRKDLIVQGNSNSCALGNSGWQDPDNPYRPTSATTPLTDAEGIALTPMGHPRDMCHAVSNTGTCVYNSQTQSRIGSGLWDRYAYFRSNRVAGYPEITNTTTNAQIDSLMIGWFNTATPTRYQVYAWEMANAATRLPPWDVGNGNNRRRAFGQPTCTAPGISPSATNQDRRMLTVAVVNCTAEGVSGRTPGIEVAHWIDVFMVEPSARRSGGLTEATDLYIEVIRETESSSGLAVQAIKKSVPYLIE